MQEVFAQGGDTLGHVRPVKMAVSNREKCGRLPVPRGSGRTQYRLAELDNTAAQPCFAFFRQKFRTPLVSMYKPIIPCLGGKRRLVKQILTPYLAHTCCVESFASGADCLFLKTSSKEGVINDINF